MDHLSLIGRCGALMMLIMTAMLAACGEREPIFPSLALVIGGLDFPHTREDLTLCQKTNDQPCLKTYQRVRTARESLLSRPRKEALQLVFDALGEYCGKQPVEFPTELSCMGAVVALYFFPTPADDLSIRAFFDRLSPPSLRKVFSSAGGWPSNRENKSVWREWVSKSRLPAEDQQSFLLVLDSSPNSELTINHLDDIELHDPGE